MSSHRALRDCPVVAAQAQAQAQAQTPTSWCASALDAQPAPSQSARCASTDHAYYEFVYDADGRGVEPGGPSAALACRCGPADQWPEFLFEEPPTWDRAVRDAFSCGPK